MVHLFVLFVVCVLVCLCIGVFITWFVCSIYIDPSLPYDDCLVLFVLSPLMQRGQLVVYLCIPSILGAILFAVFALRPLL